MKRRRGKPFKPFIRIDGARFVAEIGGQDYVLRPVQDGVRAAISAALAISRERIHTFAQKPAGEKFAFTVPLVRLCTDLTSLVEGLNAD